MFPKSRVANFALAALTGAYVWAAAAPARADDGKLLTCERMEKNCLLTAKRAEMEAQTTHRPVPANMTANFCYDSFHAAEATGVWPANPPFNFALKCVK